MTFKEQIPIELNGTVLILGQIQKIYLHEGIMSDDGQFDLQKSGSVGISGLNRYYSLTLEAEYNHARVEDVPRFS